MIEKISILFLRENDLIECRYFIFHDRIFSRHPLVTVSLFLIFLFLTIRPLSYDRFPRDRYNYII